MTRKLKSFLVRLANDCLNAPLKEKVERDRQNDEEVLFELLKKIEFRANLASRLPRR
jgi:hypothetical protein